jgi:hypothetical protein
LSALPLHELDGLIDRTQRYLGSSFVLLPRRRVQRAMMRFRYAHILSDLAEGIAMLAELLRQARAVGDLLEAAPVELAEAHHLARSIRECIELPVFIRLDRTIRSATWGPADLTGFDADIRGDSKAVACVHALIAALHQFDMVQALAVVSTRDGWSFPDLVDGDTAMFEARQLVHPLVWSAVPNDVTLDDAVRLMYVTGPNMAGKTTFIKACAIAVVFAHVGMAVPAAAARLTRVDRVFAALTVRDSIRRGESFFLAEVRRAYALVHHVADGERVFAVVDELFKGTNVLDARDATVRIVRGLACAPRSLVLVASHITDVLSSIDTPNVALAYFDGQVAGGDWKFSYRLQPGFSTRRLGLQLLEREGVLHLLDRLWLAMPAKDGRARAIGDAS